MSRRHGRPFNGKRFIGNSNTMEVHDLDNEKTSCKIDLIKHEHIVTFSPDSLSEAKKQKFNNCDHCLGGSNH